MATVDGSGLDLPTGTAPPVDVRAERRRRRREFLQALVRSKTFLVGFAILLFWVLDAMFWRVIAPHNPQAVTPAGTLKAPSGGHRFGADNLGPDRQDRSPDWGLTIADGRAYLEVAWWMVLFPAGALATLVVGVNLVADGLRRVVED